ncbi:TPA: hypothetical protein DDZ10_03620 [Candidatus Uhrbacteria bacterium]|nr:MAG: hypothetical protein UY79_C0008G0029 [Parcubacteria group bacterium GW2011_GWA2_53_21]HBL39730.1 hypothetical protein [Candidatus Uhrbacteria bacterium]
MFRRGINPDAGTAHPSPAQIDLFPPNAETRAREAETQADKNLAELLKPFSQSLDPNKAQPEMLRAQGKELLRFVFAARGLTKSGTPEDLYAGRKALAAAEALLGRYQVALDEAKAEPLNPAKDYQYDSTKSAETTQSIRGIVPEAFNPSDFWKGKPFGTTPKLSQEEKPLPKATHQARLKPPLRLENGIEPLPDSAIGSLEEGPPPVHDEIPSLEPSRLSEAGTKSGAPPRRFDLTDMDLDEERLIAHRSELSDEELLSDRNVIALAQAPEGYGTEHDRIVAEVKQRMADREARRLNEPPKHTPEQEEIIHGARSSLMQKAHPKASVENVSMENFRERRLTDIEDRLQRLRSEYGSLGFTWFSRAKRERKHQLEEAMLANQELINSLMSGQAPTDLEQVSGDEIVEAPAEEVEDQEEIGLKRAA